MPVRIVEGQLPYTGGTGIGIDTNKVISILLREENNLILVNDDNEIYTDLQLQSGLTPNSDFPVGVTVGKVLQSDGWTQSGLILNWKTTSGDYARWIYANDGKIYFDNGTGTWKQVYYSSEVDILLQQLKNYVDLNFQPKLTAGAGITIDANNVISAQGAGTGDVSGPNSSVDGHLAVFDGTTGKAIKDGGPVPTQVTVVDALDSTSTTSALSANQGKVLNDKISTLAGLGKFLSLWDCTTGQPISFPYSTPYAYTTGDYFIIETVSSATPPVNYKPDGSSYTGSASSVTESDEVEVGDVYVYDGTIWLLQSNHGKTVSFGNIAGQPSDNANLNDALNSKQPKVIDVTVTTGASTVAKVGTTTAGGYTPTKGDFLLVNFVNGCGVDNPTLNIDGSGAKNIRTGSANATKSTFTLGTTANSNIKALLYYDGTYYRCWSTTNSNTTYSAMSVAEGKTGTATTPRSITALDLKEIIKYHAVDDTAYGAGWDGQTDIAPSKNAVYDKINSMDTTIAGKQNTLTEGTGISIDSNDVISNTLPGAIVSATAPSSPTEGMVWYDTTNDVLKTYDGTNWNVTGKEYTAGIGIGIGTAHPDNQGPCGNGFHIPTLAEISALKDIMGTFSLDGGTYREEYIHLPKAGRLNTSVTTPVQSQAGIYGRYWTCELRDEMYDNYYSARSFYFSSGMALNSSSPGYGYSVRPFADTPSMPDNTWTIVYDGSSTATNAGIFYKSSLGLISASSDGVNWITISDKNLGATTVFNYGDTLSETNCGKYYQRGNNYGFARDGTVLATTNTAVDVTGYGPGNYYSSSTIYAKHTGIYSIDSWFNPVWSPNLWGGYTQGIWIDSTTGNSISNTGVISVNGQTGAVTISGGDVVVSSQTGNILQSGMKIWAGSSTDYGNLGTYDSNCLYLVIE